MFFGVFMDKTSTKFLHIVAPLKSWFTYKWEKKVNHAIRMYFMMSKKAKHLKSIVDEKEYCPFLLYFIQLWLPQEGISRPRSVVKGCNCHLWVACWVRRLVEFSDLEPIPINAGQANLKSHLTLDIPRTATDMNRTLHSDLRKSETGFTPPRPSEISEKYVSTYCIFSYKALPQIIPGNLIMPAILTILCSSFLIKLAFKGYVK